MTTKNGLSISNAIFLDVFEFAVGCWLMKLGLMLITIYSPVTFGCGVAFCDVN